MTEQAQKISFAAIVPSTESAIKFHGDGGCRITLDIDAQSEADMLPLLVMRGQLLRVTIEIGDGRHAGEKRKKGKTRGDSEQPDPGAD